MLKQKNYIRLGDYLQEKGLIDESDIQAALATAKKKGGLIGYHLVANNAISSQDIADAIIELAEERHITHVDLSLLSKIPYEFAKENNAIPLEKTKNTLIVAVLPGNDHIREELSLLTGYDIRLARVASPEKISMLIKNYYESIYSVEKKSYFIHFVFGFTAILFIIAYIIVQGLQVDPVTVAKPSEQIKKETVAMITQTRPLIAEEVMGEAFSDDLQDIESKFGIIADDIGQRSKAEVNSVINKNMKILKNLYKARQRKNPNLFGSVSFQITIDANGSVSKIKKMNDTLGDPGFIAKVQKQILRWKFKEIDFGTSIVQVPLEFYPNY